MKIKSLSWIFALVLLISIPSAYAQTLGGKNIFFIIINALIFGIILFLLQSFLLPNKPDKEKTAMWFVIIIASLLLAWFFGSSGYLWQGPLAILFNLKILVNSILIAAFLYFLLGILKIPQLGSPEGKTGYGILLFVVSVIFAVKIGNVWIWSQPTISALIKFFFGPEGILTLNKNRLFIFLITGTVLATFFNYVGLGKENAKINYLLAFIFAASLASGPDPLTFAGVKRLVLVVGTWVLGGNLSDKFTGKAKVIGYVIAFFLMLWAVSAVETVITPEGRTEVAEKGWISGFFGILWNNKGWMFLFVFLIIMTLIIWRGESRILKEGTTRVWAKILQRLRQNRKVAKVIGNYLGIRDPTLENEVPFMLKDLRVELYTLMNFLLRHEIYKAKARTAHKLFEDLGNTEKGREKVLANRLPTPEAINKNIKKYLEGGEIRKNPDGTWTAELDKETGSADIGFARTYFLVFKAMEKLKEQLERDLTREPSVDHIEEEINSSIETWKDTEFKSLKDTITTRYNRYKSGAIKRFRVVNMVRHHWYFFLDMYNLYGVYKRGCRFAKYGTKPELYAYKIASDDGILRDIDWDSLEKVGIAATAPNFEPGTHYLVEVDTYGYSTSDINAIQVERKDLQYIRKWKRNDIGYFHKQDSDIPRFSEVLELATKDWDFFVEDVERGIYHPYAKRIDNYTELIKESWMNFDKAKFDNLLTIQQIGFDYEALKCPGKFVYWGRKNYYDETRESLRHPPVNPYPTISMHGLWTFINSIADKRPKEPELAKQYVELFKLNYRDLEKPPTQGGAPAHGPSEESEEIDI